MGASGRRSSGGGRRRRGGAAVGRRAGAGRCRAASSAACTAPPRALRMLASATSRHSTSTPTTLAAKRDMGACSARRRDAKSDLIANLRSNKKKMASTPATPELSTLAAEEAEAVARVRAQYAARRERLSARAGPRADASVTRCWLQRHQPPRALRAVRHQRRRPPVAPRVHVRRRGCQQRVVARPRVAAARGAGRRARRRQQPQRCDL